MDGDRGHRLVRVVLLVVIVVAAGLVFLEPSSAWGPALMAGFFIAVLAFEALVRSRRR